MYAIKTWSSNPCVLNPAHQVTQLSKPEARRTLAPAGAARAQVRAEPASRMPVADPGLHTCAPAACPPWSPAAEAQRVPTLRTGGTSRRLMAPLTRRAPAWSRLCACMQAAKLVQTPCLIVALSSEGLHLCTAAHRGCQASCCRTSSSLTRPAPKAGGPASSSAFSIQSSRCAVLLSAAGAPGPEQHS